MYIVVEKRKAPTTGASKSSTGLGRPLEKDMSANITNLKISTQEEKKQQQKFMNLFTFLNHDNYGTYNREIAKLLGLSATVLLHELASRYSFYQENGQLQQMKDGKLYFFLTVEEAYERTSLTKDEQQTAMKVLIKEDLIIVSREGVFGKRYIHIKEKSLYKLFGIQEMFTRRESRQLDGGKASNWREEIPPSEQEKSPPYISPSKEEKTRLSYETDLRKKETMKEKEVSAVASDLTEFFLRRLKEKKPDILPNGISKWPEHFDLMIRADKRDVEKIRSVIIWLTAHDNEVTYCLCPRKLRKKFDELEMKMDLEAKADVVKINRDFALTAKAENPEQMRNLTFDKNYARNLLKGKEIPFNLPEESFKNALITMFGGTYEHR